MNKFIVCIFGMVIMTCTAQAQSIAHLTEHGKISLRGLSVVNDNIIWASGSSGTVGRSVDGGKTWVWAVVKGFEKRDFRDIEAFDASTAIIIAVAEPADILRTTDGGNTWTAVFTDTSKGMFLDALDFDSGHGEGIVVGDPMNGRIFMAGSQGMNGNWRPWPIDSRPTAMEGEAMFAASGSNVKLVSHLGSGQVDVFLVTGGKKSRLYFNNKALDLPLLQGKESTGANGIDIWEGKKGIIVGGDFAADTVSRGNCALLEIGGHITVSIPLAGPHGYRSGIAWISADRAICCGTSGVDVTADGGKSWTLISTEGYHVCKRARDGKAVFLAGPHGRISRLDW